jgi:molybdopterin molybdotransferase
MLTLSQAQAAIQERIAAATKVEWVPLRQARGRYAAEAVHAQVDNPAFDNSAMDGYACNTVDLAAHARRLPLQGESSCGSAPGVLAAGTAMRIFTGAPLPAGADAVAMQEDVTVENGQTLFPAHTHPGENIRRRGEDFRSGDLLFAPGRRFSAYDLALLATAGVDRVSVHVRPRVLVIATGDELVVPGTPLLPGQIYESNRLATLVQLEQLGAEALDGGMVRDEPQALRRLLAASDEYDFVITSGGASVGDHDLVKQVFAEIGEINFWKVKIKPGKPVAFGRVGRHTHFFALPGNPVSSLVTFKLFVEPALAAWSHGSTRMVELPARATNAFRRQAGRMEFLRAHLYTENGQLLATALPGQGSHMLGTLRQTNGFIKIGEDSAGFTEGDALSAIPLGLELT